jgi:hypothetical protein
MALVAVCETHSYLQDAMRLLSEAERESIVATLAANPTAGVLIKGGGGIRKMRIGFDGRGKRGGGRVVYWYHTNRFPVVLLAMFAKNESSDLTAAERTALAALARRLPNDFGGSHEA